MGWLNFEISMRVSNSIEGVGIEVGAGVSAGSGPMADMPVSATPEVLQVVLASMLHRQFNEITPQQIY